jgi:DNA helicase-2/ATP-dependent DNA helicase PcrA
MFPTSFSDISTFRRCGYDYLMRNIYGYQAGVPAAFGYGTRIHNILNIIYNNYMKNGLLPNDSDIESLFASHFFLRYATDAMMDNMRTGGVRVVKNYVALNVQDFNKVLETEKRFELVHDEALIKGQIDLLKKVDDQGNLDEVEVVDFKNENEQSTLYQLDNQLQLRLYALACLKALALKPKKATIHHLDLRDSRESKEEIDISEPALDEASKMISSTLVDIKSRRYTPKPTSKCKDCDWHKICSYN